MLNAFRSIHDSTAGVMTMEYLASHPLAPLFRKLDIMGTRKHVPEPNLIRGIYKFLDRGKAVVVYPEGGRRWDGKPASWITSTAKLFSRAGVPVYPVITHGSYVGWPRWARYPRRANIQLEILPPVAVDRSTPVEVALERLQNPIAIDENIVSKEIQPKRAYRPAEGIGKLLYRDPKSGVLDALLTKDGSRIMSRSGGIDWTMLADSRIRDNADGSLFTTGECYERIRTGFIQDLDTGLTFELTADVSGTMCLPGHRERSESFTETDATVCFNHDHLLIRGEKVVAIPLDRIRYAGTERNNKLVVTLDNGSVSFLFRSSGSPLMLYDAIIARSPDLRQ